MTANDCDKWRKYAARTATKCFDIKGEDLEDVIQQCVIDIYKVWSKPKGDRDDYFGTVVKNRCRMFLRHKYYLQTHELVTGLWFDRGESNDAILDEQDFTELKQSTIVDYLLCSDWLRTQPEVDQTVINLFADGNSQTQIGKALNITQNQAKNIIDRVRTHFKIYLDSVPLCEACVVPEDYASNDLWTPS